MTKPKRINATPSKRPRKINGRGPPPRPKGLAALKAAVELLGGQTNLAKAIGVSQGAVWQALNGHKQRATVPGGWCPKIEAATKGKIKREDLRPDLYL